MAAKTVTVTASMARGFTVESRIRDHVLYADQPKPLGGADKGPTPLEYLFLSLGSCIASIARIMASQQRLPLRRVDVTVSGSLDTDVLLGKHDGRSGFSDINVRVGLDADMTPGEKRAFLAEVERRCPVSDNLQTGAPLTCTLAES